MSAPLLGDERAAAALRRAVASRRDELIAFTRALVRERSLVGAEEGAQALIAERLSRIGFQVRRVEIDPPEEDPQGTWGYPPRSYAQRTCVAGRIDGSGQACSLHLSGHVDVVPVESPERWRHDPWAAEVAGGRIWGRGAGDMKAGLAAYMIAAEAFLEVCGAPLGDLVFSSVIEEECTGNGMKAVLAAGYGADATLIGEPSGLALMHAGVGVIWARLRAEGAGAHVAFSTGGSSSERILAALAGLRALESELNAYDPQQADADPDAVFFSAHEKPFRLNVGTLAGGVWPSSEPVAAEARVRVGFGRKHTPAQVQELVSRAVALAAPEVEVCFEGFRAPAYCDELRHDLGAALAASHDVLHGSAPARLALPGTTDARSVTGPCVCYGPLAGAIHASDEWVDIDSTEAVACALALTIAALQSPRARP